MARVKLAGTTGASENTIVFLPAGGHSHNGQNSSLIDSTAYSMFDFSPTFVGTEINPERAVRQENNRIAFEDTIRRVVNNSVLAPAGIRLGVGSLNGSLIIANTITSNQLAANTITADEIAANAVTANELAANLILVDNVIKSNNYDGTIASNNVITSNGTTGWAITSSGQAEFGNAVLRGNVTANAGSIGGWTINSSSITAGNTSLYSNGVINASNAVLSGNITANAGNIGGWTVDVTSIATGNTSLYSNGSIVIGNTSISSNGQITNGGYTLSSTGALTATGVNITGVITSTSGSIGGWSINSNNIAGGNTILYSNGYIYATAGVFAGSLSGASITGATGTFSGAVSVSDGSNGIEITTDGYIKGLGGSGVRIKNSDGTTGTQLFAGSVLTNTVNASLLSITNGTEYFEADTLGARIRTNGNRPLTLYRNYVSGADFIRLLSTDASGSSGSPHEVGRASFATANTVVWSTSSDRRLKENIVKIDNALNIVQKLNPVEFNFINDEEHTVTGFIAQEVYDVLPSVVSVGGEDPKERPWAIDYSGFSPILTSAIQELIIKIDMIEARLNALEGV